MSDLNCQTQECWVAALRSTCSLPMQVAVWPLESKKPPVRRYADPLDLFDVVRKYANATRRLLVLGVGGTFLPATGATANDVMQLSATQVSWYDRLI